MSSKFAVDGFTSEEFQTIRDRLEPYGVITAQDFVAYMNADVDLGNELSVAKFQAHLDAVDMAIEPILEKVIEHTNRKHDKMNLVQLFDVIEQHGVMSSIFKAICGKKTKSIDDPLMDEIVLQIHGLFSTR
jgi:hypothetical protein